MGGNALKPFEVRRFSTMEGLLVKRELLPILRKYFLFVTPTRSVIEKIDHGDMDIVVGGPINSQWKEDLYKELNPKAAYSNGNVHSFEYQGIQVDLIHITDYDPDDMDSMKWPHDYFSDNDFGNLIGRIARHLGFTFGSQGFTYTIYDTEGNYKRELLISRDQPAVFKFLGYTRTRPWSFATFNDMFEFVTSSILFDPTIYFLENRNHEGRHRDKKRVNYGKFLDFLKAKYPGCENWDFRQVNKEIHIHRAIQTWPELGAKIQAAHEEAALNRRIKKAFPGDLITLATGLQGKELGEFIRAHKALTEHPEYYELEEKERIVQMMRWHRKWKDS